MRYVFVESDYRSVYSGDKEGRKGDFSLGLYVNKKTLSPMSWCYYKAIKIYVKPYCFLLDY